MKNLRRPPTGISGFFMSKSLFRFSSKSATYRARLGCTALGEPRKRCSSRLAILRPGCPHVVWLLIWSVRLLSVISIPWTFLRLITCRVSLVFRFPLNLWQKIRNLLVHLNFCSRPEPHMPSCDRGRFQI